MVREFDLMLLYEPILISHSFYFLLNLKPFVSNDNRKIYFKALKRLEKKSFYSKKRLKIKINRRKLPQNLKCNKK